MPVAGSRLRSRAVTGLAPWILISACGLGFATSGNESAPEQLASEAPPETSKASPPESSDISSGVSGELFVTFDDSHVIAGGPDRTRSASRVLFDGGVEFDAERAFGLTGLTFRIGAQALAGQVGTELTGDLQVFDNIDAEPFVGVSEISMEQRWQGDRFKLKIGRMDANGEFASVDDNALAVRVRARRTFIHSSMGFSPTMIRFASYPNQAIGAVFDAHVGGRARFSAGLFDGSLRPALASTLESPTGAPLFSSVFGIAEFGLGWNGEQRAGQPKAGDGSPAGLGRGRFTLGGWLLADRELPGAVAGGPYLVVSQTLWRRPGRPEQGLGAFAQYAYTGSAASQLQHHAGGGLTWVGPVARRERDVLGLGASWVRVRLESDSDAARRFGNETAVELFYRVSILPDLWVQPDVQVLINPAGRGPSTGVMTLRVALDV